MNKKELIKDVLAGKEVDRIPFTLFYHFTSEEPKFSSGKPMVDAHINFYKRASPDFLKVMFDYNYDHIQGRIRSIDDWTDLDQFTTIIEHEQSHLQSLSQLFNSLGKETFIITTIFSVVSLGQILCNFKLGRHLSEDPDTVFKGLKAINDKLIAFTKNCIKSGAAGIFFSNFADERDKLTQSIFNQFIKPLEIDVIKSSKEFGSKFNILHIHGKNRDLENYIEYDCDVINWDHFQNNLSLLEGKKLFTNKVIMGGINHEGQFLKGNEKEVKNELRTVLREMGHTRFILGPTCAFSQKISTERINWIKAVLYE